MTTLKTNVVRLKLDEIVESPLNPRTHFDAEKLREFGSRLRLQGQKVLIQVRPHPTQAGLYELADGARRLRGARMAGMDGLDALVGNFTDAQIVEMSMATGTDSEPLTPIEEALGWKHLMDLQKMSLREFAAARGLDHRNLGRQLSLLELPKSVREAVDAGEFAAHTAYLVARIPGESERKLAAKEIMHPEVQEEPLSFRAAKAMIETKYCRTLAGAPFNPKDKDLLPEAGACSACLFRAGSNPEVYGDVSNGNTCMKPTCFLQKTEAAREQVAVKLRAEGRVVLDSEENEAAFPREDEGLSFRSEFVEYLKPVPAWMLKEEITEAPKWCDLTAGKVSVQVYAGFNQAGMVVELVKTEEAVLAASENDHAIFSQQARRRYCLGLGGKKEEGRSQSEEGRDQKSEAQVGNSSAKIAASRPALINQEERDNDLVDRLAAALKDRLAADRADGETWDWAGADDEAVEQFKENAGNALEDFNFLEAVMFAAFAWNHGERSEAKPAAPLPPKVAELDRAMIELLAASAGVKGQMDRIAQTFAGKPWAKCESLADLQKVHRALTVAPKAKDEIVAAIKQHDEEA